MLSVFSFDTQPANRNSKSVQYEFANHAAPITKPSGRIAQASVMDRSSDTDGLLNRQCRIDQPPMMDLVTTL
jgi:hypothetical protein